MKMTSFSLVGTSFNWKIAEDFPKITCFENNDFNHTFWFFFSHANIIYYFTWIAAQDLKSRMLLSQNVNLKKFQINHLLIHNLIQHVSHVLTLTFVISTFEDSNTSHPWPCFLCRCLFWINLMNAHISAQSLIFTLLDSFINTNYSSFNTFYYTSGSCNTVHLLFQHSW